MVKNIPDRWIPYTSCGTVIEGTNIICFKVPLRNEVQKNVKEIKEIWDIPTLLKKIPGLGGVIDLTNTSRYYNPKELLAAGVFHEKIEMEGRILPPENKVKRFSTIVKELLEKRDDMIIGVHCTHGLNRTGYMVCRYMRDELGIPPQEAIDRFQKARGYQIEREKYIAAILGKEQPHGSDIGKTTLIKPVDDTNNKGKLKRTNDSSVSDVHIEDRNSDCYSKRRKSPGRSKSRWDDKYDYRFDY